MLVLFSNLNMSEINLSKNYIPPLTGLRFIAAFMVFVHHFTPSWLPWRVYDALQEFHIGVTVFFVLSGFLICLRYYNNFELNAVWFRKYMLNRIARIYPMYFLITTVTIYFTHEGFNIYLLNISFLRGFFDDFKFTGIHQGWSLTVEECFYFSAPLIFFLSKKFWLLVQPVFIILAGIAITSFFNDINYHGLFGNYRFTMLYTFFGRCFEFFAGIKLAQLMINSSKILTKKIPYTITGCAGIVAVVIALSLIKGDLRYGVWQNEGILLNNFILPVFICFLLNGLIKEKTFLSRFLSTPVLDLLGKASYTFYLIHLGLLHIFYTKYISTNIFLELIIATVSSIVLYKFFEEPMNRVIKNTKLFGLLKSR